MNDFTEQSHAYLESITQQLMDAGFPESYAVPLAALSLSHPSWTFEPLLVPEAWEQILYWEVDENPARSLITKAEAYAPYRHGSNTALYDTGYYQASRDAVAYFMDPRNFFNEADIFQFFCFETAPTADTLVAVEAVLKGSFMENSVIDDGKTYAQTFVEVAEALGLSPIYLVVRARQEQGVKGGMTIGGDAGERLAAWLAAGTDGASSATDTPASLAAYNGYYNIFNISASGTGRYHVLKAAMNRAMQGSPEMATTWGNAAWNTVGKSIWGGALTIKARYIDNDQNTVYLQKFNVSPDSSRRFWGQYMQHIPAALSEGRSLYTAFDAAGALDSACVFRIPVYADIPAACPDPAAGSCAYTAPSASLLSVNGKLRSGEQTLLLPVSLAEDISRGELPTLHVRTTAANGLRLLGELSANARIMSLSLQPVAKNGVALASGPTCLYQSRAQGCDTLHLQCNLPLPDDAAAGDVYTYALTLHFGDNDKRCRSLTITLVEIAVE